MSNSTSQQEPVTDSTSICKLFSPLPVSPATKELRGITDGLLDKANRKDRRIVFFGHFSAGKSSLINALIGEEILPRNPVPTSARPVFIRSGTPGAIVRFVDDETRNRIDMDKGNELFEAACRGELERDVASLELLWPADSLAGGLTMVDTPGVDSTDPSHRLVTEELILQADLAVYCTDYKKALSETNRDFIQFLNRFEVPVVLVVTQIDKHSELEMPFVDYRQTLLDAASNWGLESTDVYPITIREHTPLWANPENRYQDLKKHLLAVQGMETAGLRDRFKFACKRYIDLRCRERGVTRTDDETLRSRSAKLLQRRQDIASGGERIFARLKEMLDRLLANNNATETLVDAIDAYAESCQPKFKVGLISTASKVARERARRCGILQGILVDMFERDMVWIARDEAEKIVEEFYQPSGELRTHMRELSFKFSSEQIEELVQKQGHIDKGLSKILLRDLLQVGKAEVRTLVRSIHQLTETEFRKVTTYELEKIDEELNDLAPERASLESMESEITYLDTISTAIVDKLLADTDTEEAQTVELAATAVRQTVHSGTMTVDETPMAIETSDVHLIDEFDLVRKKIVALSEKTSALFPSESPAIEEIDRWSQKVEDGHFVVAVFGAFSSGKTSFINSLMGDRVLPTSPHPTTATMNRIVAQPGGDRADGTLRYKSAERLAREVFEACSDLDIEHHSDGSLSSASAKLITARLKREGGSEGARIFLSGFLAGWEVNVPRLGSERSVDRDEFQVAIVRESDAIFIEEATLPVAEELVGKGVEIIDTPGIGSINQRHSRLALDCLLKADALIYVSYYQHAFTENDREFLDELCRLRSNLEKDSLFFVLNAIDLAEGNQQELAGVKNHLAENLEEIGFKQPSISPLSAECALLSDALIKGDEDPRIQDLFRARAVRRSGNELPDPAENLKHSGLPQFRSKLERFVVAQKGSLLVQGAADASIRNITGQQGMLRAEKSMIEDGPDAHKESVAHWTQARDIAADSVQTLKDDMRRFFLAAIQKIGNESEELFFFVGKRLKPRLTDWLKEGFVPLRLEEFSAGDRLMVLQKQARQVTAHLISSFEAELRITAARLLTVLNRELAGGTDSISIEMNTLVTPMQQIFPQAGDANIDLRREQIDAIELIFIQDEDLWGRGLSELSAGRALLRNAEEMKQKYRVEVKEHLEGLIDDFLVTERDRIASYFLQVIENELAAEQEVVIERFTAFEEGHRRIIDETDRLLTANQDERTDLLRHLDATLASCEQYLAEWQQIRQSDTTVE